MAMANAITTALDTAFCIATATVTEWDFCCGGDDACAAHVFRESEAVKLNAFFFHILLDAIDRVALGTDI